MKKREKKQSDELEINTWRKRNGFVMFAPYIITNWLENGSISKVKKHKENAEYVSIITKKINDLAHQQNAKNVSFVMKEINDVVKKENAKI